MSKQPQVKAIYDFIDHIAPFETAESWDNVGLLVGSDFATVNKVLLALDITEAVVDEAIEGDFNLIITHHPIIFNGIQKITYEDRKGGLLLKLIQHKISVIAAHTNLDRSFEFGINQTIANLYPLVNLKPLNAFHQFGVVGDLLKAETFDTFIEKTKALFGIQIVKVANFKTTKEPRFIQTIALSSGASSDFIVDALSVKADVYITSDLKYHEAQTVIGTDLILVDIGHFESERIYMKPFKKLLEAYASEHALHFIVKVTENETPIFVYL